MNTNEDRTLLSRSRTELMSVNSYPVSSEDKYIYKIFMIQAALSFIRNETFEKAM